MYFRALFKNNNNNNNNSGNKPKKQSNCSNFEINENEKNCPLESVTLSLLKIHSFKISGVHDYLKGSN